MPAVVPLSGMATDQHIATAGKYTYDDLFYRYIQQGATCSARTIVPLVVQSLKVESVLDVGCGAGAWLAEYANQRVPICLGVDGDYVKPASLLVPAQDFVARDISQPFDLEKRFDLVQCLEVGEHLNPSASRTLVANLVRHSDFVLFSAAVPGQGGENHINEQPYEFWRKIFAEHGYQPYDFVRPLVRRTKSVEGWYRRNVMLYVANRSQLQLGPAVATTRVPDGEPIPDVSGVLYKLRTRILAALPVAWLSALAVLKHRCILWCRVIARRREI